MLGDALDAVLDRPRALATEWENTQRLRRSGTRSIAPVRQYHTLSMRACAGQRAPGSPEPRPPARAYLRCTREQEQSDVTTCTFSNMRTLRTLQIILCPAAGKSARGLGDRPAAPPPESRRAGWATGPNFANNKHAQNNFNDSIHENNKTSNIRTFEPNK